MPSITRFHRFSPTLIARGGIAAVEVTGARVPFSIVELDEKDDPKMATHFCILFLALFLLEIADDFRSAFYLLVRNVGALQDETQITQSHSSLQISKSYQFLFLKKYRQISPVILDAILKIALRFFAYFSDAQI